MRPGDARRRTAGSRRRSRDDVVGADAACSSCRVLRARDMTFAKIAMNDASATPIMSAAEPWRPCGPGGARRSRARACPSTPAEAAQRPGEHRHEHRHEPAARAPRSSRTARASRPRSAAAGRSTLPGVAEHAVAERGRGQREQQRARRRASPAGRRLRAGDRLAQATAGLMRAGARRRARCSRPA